MTTTYTQRDANFKLGYKYHRAKFSGKMVLCQATKRACPNKDHMSRENYLIYKNAERNPQFDPDVFYAQTDPNDPFDLSSRIGGFDVPSVIQQQHFTGEINFETYSNYARGITQPKSSQEIYLVKLMFKTKEKVNIPKGTMVSSTNPKYNRTGGHFRKSGESQIKPLNINSGSEGYGRLAVRESDKFQPVSLTWVGSDNYFYNVKVTDALLDANR